MLNYFKSKMKKNIRIIAVTILLLSLFSLSLFFWIRSLIDFVSPAISEKATEFPDIELEFEMQGLQGISFSYYYEDEIYSNNYTEEFVQKLLTETKNTGANSLLIRAAYNGTETGDIEANEEEMMRTIGNFIDLAHEYSIQIFLVPYVESMDYWVDPRWTLDQKIWEDTVIKWAEFAESHNVELFAPGMEMNLILDEAIVGNYFKNILPRIKKVYSGKVTTAEHPYLDRWELLDKEDAFRGYDCIGMSFFLWKDYGEGPDMKSVQDFTDETRNKAILINDLADKYEINCKVAATMGLDFWQGKTWEEDAPDNPTKAAVFDAGLDVLKENGFYAVFIHEDALELDAKKRTKDVKEMLKARWTK